MEQDKQLVEYILGSICNGKYEVTRSIDERGVLLTIQAQKADMPIIVGKEGTTLGSIRRLAKIVGRRNNASVAIRLLEP